MIKNVIEICTLQIHKRKLGNMCISADNTVTKNWPKNSYSLRK